MRDIKVNVEELRIRSLAALRDRGYAEEPLQPLVVEVAHNTHEDTVVVPTPSGKAPAATGAALEGFPTDVTRVLRLAVKDPVSLLSELTELAGLEGKRADLVRQELLTQPALVEMVRVPTGVRGRMPYWVRPLPELFEALGEARVPDIARCAQYKHRFGQIRVARSLKANDFRDVAIEKNVNGKKIDVAGTSPEGVFTAYEFERQDTQPHLVENVVADLRAGLQRVVVLVTSRKQRQRAQAELQQHLTPEDAHRASVEPLGKYL